MCTGGGRSVAAASWSIRRLCSRLSLSKKIRSASPTVSRPTVRLLERGWGWRGHSSPHILAIHLSLFQPEGGWGTLCLSHYYLPLNFLTFLRPCTALCMMWWVVFTGTDRYSSVKVSIEKSRGGRLRFGLESGQMAKFPAFIASKSFDLWNHHMPQKCFW